jgi:hypothetical protein
MNVQLTYQSGQQYSEHFAEFKVTVSGGGRKRIRISFKEKESGHGFATFTLPVEKGQQLAHAILAAAAGIEDPIVFEVEEPKPKAVAA